MGVQKIQTIVNPTYSKVKYEAGVTGASFENFYPFYLAEHRQRTNRRLHIVGTTTVAMMFVYLVVSRQLRKYWWALLLQGYGFAWVGHFFFEKNKPATFKHPILSLRGDWKMWYEVMTGKRRF